LFRDYTGRPVPEESHKLLINGFYSHWAKLYKHVITDNDHHLLQNGLNSFQEWSNRCLLKLNINKCKIALHKRDVNYEYKYYLLPTALENVDVVKDLGVVFDSELFCSLLIIITIFIHLNLQ